MKRPITESLAQQLGRLSQPNAAQLAGRLLTLARNSSDTDGLIAVARCRHHDRDLHQRIANEKHPSVRAAWLANPTADADLVADTLAKETRANVIAAAISQAGQQRDNTARSTLLQNTARDRLTAKPTIALAESLVTVDELDPECSLIVTCTLVAGTRTLSTARERALTNRINALAKAHGPQLIHASASWHTTVAIARAGAILDNPLLADVADRIVTGADNDVAGKQPWAQNRTITLATDAIGALLRENQPDAKTLDQIHRRAKLARDTRLRDQVTTLVTNAKANLGVIVDDNDVVSLTKRAVQGGDVTAIAALAAHRDIAGTPQQLDALTLLARHNLPLAARIAADSDVRDQFTRDNVIELSASGLLADLLGSDNDTRAEKARAIIEYYTNEKTGRISAYTQGRRIAALLPHAGVTGLDRVNWPHVAELISVYHGSEELNDSIVGILLARLTSDDHWRVFDTLTSQWTGALADLLGAVDALVDTPQPD